VLQVVWCDSRDRHVEVFRLGGVRTPIIGRPRLSPDHRRTERYTFVPEEPLYDARVWFA
jgi:hypothetical protein